MTRSLKTLLFLLFWVIMTTLYVVSSDWSFTNVSSVHLNSLEGITQTTRLLEGVKLSGRLTATDNNLGVIAIRFETYERPVFENEDILLFRLRELGTDKWIYTNYYRIGLIYDSPIFPFGFPIIKNSKGKKYTYEIVSLYGNSSNSVSVRAREPIVSSKYVYTKPEISKSVQSILAFILRKFGQVTANIDIFYSSVWYLLPLMYFCFGKKHLGQYMYIFLQILILMDIVFLQLKNDGIYLVFLGITLTEVIQNYFKPKWFVGCAVCCFIGASISALWKSYPTSEQFAIYGFLNFAAFMIFELIQLRNNPKR